MIVYGLRLCAPSIVDIVIHAWRGVMKGSSYVWRRMLQVRELAEQNLWWLVWLGPCNFWFDNWLGSSPLCQQLQRVSDHSILDFVSNGRWNHQLLNQWVLDHIVAEIVSKPVPTGEGQDCAVWWLTESGEFSIASSYLLSRGQTPSLFMFDRAWNPLLPVKISFLWCVCC